MSLIVIFKWLVDIALFFIIRGYLHGSPKWMRWMVWIIFGFTVAIDLYFFYWYNCVLGRVPNDWLTAYFGGIMLCIYMLKATFISLYAGEWFFWKIKKLCHFS